MNLVTDEQLKLYVDADLWGDNPETHSLDGIVRLNANEAPDTSAFIDAPNRSVWTSGEARSLTWAQLNREVDILATFLQGLDLATDAVIALYGPNTVDMAVSILAVNRAGFIAAPIPLFWRQTEMRDYLTEVHARAIITVDRIEEDAPALRCRDLMQTLFSMKYILGFGDNLPDGVVNLDQILPAVPDMMDPEASFDAIAPNAVISLHPTCLQSRDTEITLPRTSNQWLCAERATFGMIENSKRTLLPFALSGFIGFCAGIVHTLKHQGTLYFHHYQTENTLAGHLDLVKPNLVLLPQNIVARQMSRFTSKQSINIGSIWKNDHLAKMPIEQSDNGSRLFDITIINEVAAIGQPRLEGDQAPSPLPLSEDVQDLAFRLRKPSNSKLKQSEKLAGGELIATGASVPEALFPSNSEKRALSRLRNKTAFEGAYTHVGCRLQEGDTSKCEPIGFLIETVQRTNQVTVAAELDDLYKAVPNVLDAAYFIDPKTNDLHVAVVTRGPVLSIEEFSQALSELGVSHLKVPVSLFPTDEIKRGVGGVVIRHELVALIEQSKARKIIKDRQQAAI